MGLDSLRLEVVIRFSFLESSRDKRRKTRTEFSLVP